jgi:hypothetical protein
VPNALDSNVELKNWKPELGLSQMTSVAHGNEKCYWLLQTFLTPYNASRAGYKYEPSTWAGTPLIRVIWVNRNGHLAEFQQWLEGGEEVQVPSLWELTVDEVIDIADMNSAMGNEEAVKQMAELQANSTLIDDVIEWEEKKSLMAKNCSQFGPNGKTARNGFPQPLRQAKIFESRHWA